MFIIIFALSDDEYCKFTRLYEEYHASLLKYSKRLLKDQRLAEEAVHDAFVRIMKNLHKISESERSKTWFFMVVIVKRVCLTILKKNNDAAFHDIGEPGIEVVADQEEPFWSEYQAKELYERINIYVNTELNEIDRRILTYRANHLSYKEIADLTGITESNVSARLSRLRQKMKADLAIEEAKV